MNTIGLSKEDLTLSIQRKEVTCFVCEHTRKPIVLDDDYTVFNDKPYSWDIDLHDLKGSDYNGDDLYFFTLDNPDFILNKIIENKVYYDVSGNLINLICE